MSALLNISVQFYQTACGRCGGAYAISEDFRAEKERNGGAWYCPYCQVSWNYAGETELDRAKKALAEQRQRTADALARANEAQAERDKLAKKLKRVEKGICPCCKRSFVDLQRHIATKHPGGVTS